MNKVFKLSLLLVALLFMASCGSKKSPTGGPVDLEKPEVLSIIPEEYSQLGSEIEITFSKAMDKQSFTEGIYFHPPIINKKISYSGRTLNIKIMEPLQPDCVYHLTLGSGVKDTRSNSLNKPNSFVFLSGKPVQNRISGQVTYEKAGDAGKPLTLSLFSADSLLVLHKEISGSSYLIDPLNPAEYRMRAYQDLDLNGRYDYGREPFFEQLVDVRKSRSFDINMAYQDSTRAVIRNIRPISNTQLEVHLSKVPASMGKMEITSSDGGTLAIRYSELSQKVLTLITAEQDTLQYRLTIKDLKDSKGNLNPESSLAFMGCTVPDTEKPTLTSSIPRNGTSVASLQPTLELNFDEIIPEQHLKLRLIATESNKEVPIQILKADSKTCKVKPTTPLTNYRSYTLIILAETSDSAGNALEKEHKISFMPLIQ